MPKRKVWRVRPVKEGGWRVQEPDGESRSFPLKPLAVAFAKAAALIAWTRHKERAQVVVHKKDGKIQYESTYGLDPKRYPS
jgi:predicted transcriptional regulator